MPEILEKMLSSNMNIDSMAGLPNPPKVELQDLEFSAGTTICILIIVGINMIYDFIICFSSASEFTQCQVAHHVVFVT